MAANYWMSTQRRFWLFDPSRVAEMREDVERQHSKVIEQFPLPDRRLMFVFMKERLIQLGKRLSFRQQCVATALVYIQRYLLFQPLQSVNLYLLTATAFYLASKTEESPHHIRLVASEARQAWPEYMPGDAARLGEMEFCLISEMHSQLIVWHPYRSLMALKENQNLALTNEELGLAWSIINDTFMTDLPLTCPPHLIAVTAMFLAVVFVPTKSAMDLKQFSSDTQMMDPGRFASIGGKSGVSNAFGNAVDGASVPQSPTAATKVNVQGPDSKAVRAKTLAAAAGSEKMQKVIRFLVESDVDVERMIEATQEIISLYEIWEQYNEKTIKDAVTRYLRGHQTDT